MPSLNLTMNSHRMVVLLLAMSLASLTNANTCRCFPGDACWPSLASWNSLNSSVGGRLIATVPLGSPCHDPNYNATECITLRDNWFWPPEQFVMKNSSAAHILNLRSYNSSSSIMAPFYQSYTPFSSVRSSCLLGDYADYAIDVTSPSDIAKCIAFATDNNIKLVIRNTGHE